jgi:hypothetical protein
LAPLENLVTLQVYPTDLCAWRGMAGDGCVVFEAPPTTAQVRTAREVILLDPTLELVQYERRRVIGGLSFIAPEDLCLDLIERARGETSPAEAAAILIAQRDSLAWDVLLAEAKRRVLARRLGALIEATGDEMGTAVAPSEFVRQLHASAMNERTPVADDGYPPGRRQPALDAYASLAERWGIRWRLPRYVIGKVVFDLGQRQAVQPRQS